MALHRTGIRAAHLAATPAGLDSSRRSTDAEIDDPADQFARNQVRVGVVDLVEPVPPGHHLVEAQQTRRNGTARSRPAGSKPHRHAADPTRIPRPTTAARTRGGWPRGSSL